MTPAEKYQADIQQQLIQHDVAQAEALQALQKLYEQLLVGNTRCASAGLYIWGKVGRGKTYLMDCFYNCLPFEEKTRLHFYRFMQHVHHEMKRLQGKEDPLKEIARQVAAKNKVLCIDEFFVSDIGDAMILGRLLEGLFACGVVVVTTSNVEPAELYKDGLQRDRFLPAIAMLEAQLDIIHMLGKQDYRLSKGNGLKHYYVAEEGACAQFQQRFIEQANSGAIIEHEPVDIEAREIMCRMRSDKALWFEFEHLFCGPRSAHDYIALAKRGCALYVSHVPQMGGALNERKVARGTEDTVNINQRVADRPFVLAKGDDEARRFISFVDEIYDQGVLLVLSACVPVEQLYLGGRVVNEFERTVSRIIEMQAESYGS